MLSVTVHTVFSGSYQASSLALLRAAPVDFSALLSKELCGKLGALDFLERMQLKLEV